LAKFGVILAVAKYLVWDIENRFKLKYIIICGIIVGIPSILIFKQPDLGTMLTFVPTICAMLFAAGMRWRYIIIAWALSIASAPFLWAHLRPYQKKRVFTFLYPEHDPFGSGYSVIQSKIAVGSGGILGKGWLGGTQNQLNFIPERHTDFIFSVVGEEWGFVGSLALVTLFFMVISAGFNIAHKAPDVSGKILALGITTIFGFQVSVNIGMTIGLLPVTGIPLPFISYGGTSLLATMAMMGLLQNIYMRRFMF
jgi:rod shape determining protein RodA